MLAGAAAAAANVVARWMFSLALPYDLSIVLAYCVGMLVAFTLNRNIVFADRDGRVAGQLRRFAIVNVFSLGQVWVVSVVLLRFILPSLAFNWHNETVAHSIGVASPVVTSYFAHKHFSFAPQPQDPRSRRKAPRVLPE